MGRPLHKKYFGNRNTGSSSTTADDGIGGEGLGAYTLSTLGSVLVNSSYPQPPFVIGAPTLPLGVQATAIVVWEVESIVMTDGGSGYSAPDTVTFTGLGGGVVGKQTATGAGPTYAATAAGINFTDAGASRGNFTTIPTAALTYEVCTTAVTTGTTNGQCQVKFRVKSITTSESGSGYVAAPSLSWTSAGTSGVMPAAPSVALTSTQENSITMVARLLGGTAVVVDIIKQVSTRRYKVTDGVRTGIVTLKSSVATAVGECSIAATDAGAGTYYVTKLTAHRATLHAGTGSIYTSGTEELSVPWTLGTATATVCKIPNA